MNIIQQSKNVIVNDSFAINLYSDLPQDLLEYIDEKLPKYTFLERVGILHEYENELLKINPHPFYTRGDFNGDSLDDFVLVLQSPLAKLEIIAFNSNKDSFDIYHIKDDLLQYYVEYSNSIQISLDYNMKGEYDGAESKIYFANDFFSISYLDASSTKSFRWEGDYKRIDFLGPGESSAPLSECSDNWYDFYYAPINDGSDLTGYFYIELKKEEQSKIQLRVNFGGDIFEYNIGFRCEDDSAFLYENQNIQLLGKILKVDDKYYLDSKLIEKVDAHETLKTKYGYKLKKGYPED
ncbi:MAG: hypothetical protein LBV74_22230 [Tannerella sp.]|nr:hypothetical protein [Tannerella sp.]